MEKKFQPKFIILNKNELKKIEFNKENWNKLIEKHNSNFYLSILIHMVFEPVNKLTILPYNSEIEKNKSGG